MLRHEPGTTLAHRLDPRAKLAFQVAFAALAFARPTPRWLLGLTALALATLALAGGSLRETAAEYRVVLPFLVAAPLFEGARLGAPWFEPSAAVDPALASYRVLLLLLVSAAYVRSTPVRESRAAIQWLLPGRAGSFLGATTAMVLRFVPLLRTDVRQIRRASRARLGDQRPTTERVRHLGIAGLRRLFRRSDRLALALRARCFSWNPTPPELAFRAPDWALLGVSACLLVLAYA